VHHEFIPYRIAFRRPVATGAGEWAERRGAWLRLVADDGRVGFGEVAPLGPVATDADLAAAIASGPSRDAAFDLAMLDIEAQRFGRPMAFLLADSPRGKVTVNALLFEEDPELLAEAAARAVGAGFRSLKLKVAGVSPEQDIRRIRAVRESAGSGVALRIDANGAWDEDTALAVLRAVRACDIEYVEDPVPGDPAAVGRRSGVPVAADVPSLAAGDRIVRERRADVLVLKPMALGGVRPTRELAVRAIAAGIGVVVTSILDTAVGIAGALHLAASLPGTERAHGLATADLLEPAPVEGLEPPQGGEMQLPRGPGLGVRLRERTP